ncbi:MAG: hypothetical protein R3277_07780 [Brumimicrobium sp.]|nr:hypothetical protein [Brumimicrobium sp.]
MKSSFLLFLSVILLFACRKDQRVKNRIDGKWNVISANIYGFGEVEPEMVFNFDWCKTRKDDFCDFSAYDFAKNEMIEGVYSISEDGKSLVLDWKSNQNYNFEVFDIERLNFRTLILINKNPYSSFFSKMKFRSIN